MAQFAQVEIEAALEQDQRHADGDHRLQQFAEGGFGIEQTQDRPGKEAGGEHQHDRGPARAPSNPLRPDAEHADKRDDECLFFHYPPGAIVCV